MFKGGLFNDTWAMRRTMHTFRSETYSAFTWGWSGFPAGGTWPYCFLLSHTLAQGRRR